MSEGTNKKNILLIGGIIISLIFNFLYFYFFLPTVSLQSTGFDFLLFIDIIIIISAIGKKCADSFKSDNWVIPTICSLVLVIVVALIASGKMFHASTYANRITVEKGDFNKDVPAIKDVGSIALMDTNTASMLGDRTIGSLSNVVSQYTVSDDYTTIDYDNTMYKITSLKYNGFFKYLSNKENGIPGYVLVNTKTNEAKFVQLKQGIQYAPSAYFSRDLMRHARMQYLTKFFRNYTFQIDDNGKPYWVITTYKPQTLFGCEKINGAIIMDAITGQSKYYDLKNIPEWVDYVYTGNAVSEYYDSYGTLQGGWFNSLKLFGQHGCTESTPDFGYIKKGNDIYVYTGVTSASNNNSNLGFVLANTRTGEFKYYESPGAEEKSAMKAAEGAVQNYRYSASFPALVNIDNNPAYIMVLKDSSGIIKMYGIVDVKNYTIVATGTTLSESFDNYKVAMEKAGKSVDIENIKMDINDKKEKDIESSIIVKNIQFITIKGDTFIYINDGNKTYYKQLIKEDDQWITLHENDKINIKYPEDKKNNDMIKVS